MNYTNMFNEYPDIVTTNEMIKMLRIGRNKAYELLNSNAIRSILAGNKGRTRYIPKECIIDYLSKQLEV
ncbi:MAG: helix-turn-helix domain-containing protein [Oscillospiraceae bacterium]|nr:helix-turn-helix domain-containing protein [Oscillospiraceae bacterium]